MSQRIDDLPTWKVGSSLATAAVLAWLFGFVGPALVLALVGAGFMVSALASRRRKSPGTDSTAGTARRR